MVAASKLRMTGDDDAPPVKKAKTAAAEPEAERSDTESHHPEPMDMDTADSVTDSVDDSGVDDDVGSERDELPDTKVYDMLFDDRRKKLTDDQQRIIEMDRDLQQQWLFPPDDDSDDDDFGDELLSSSDSDSDSDDDLDEMISSSSDEDDGKAKKETPYSERHVQLLWMSANQKRRVQVAQLTKWSIKTKLLQMADSAKQKRLEPYLRVIERVVERRLFKYKRVVAIKIEHDTAAKDMSDSLRRADTELIDRLRERVHQNVWRLNTLRMYKKQLRDCHEQMRYYADEYEVYSVRGNIARLAVNIQSGKVLPDVSAKRAAAHGDKEYEKTLSLAVKLARDYETTKGKPIADTVAVSLEAKAERARVQIEQLTNKEPWIRKAIGTFHEYTDQQRVDSAHNELLQVAPYQIWCTQRDQLMAYVHDVHVMDDSVSLLDTAGVYEHAKDNLKEACKWIQQLERGIGSNFPDRNSFTCKSELDKAGIDAHGKA